MYQNRPLPYDHTGLELQVVDYFRTHPPSDWIGKEQREKQFAQIYGDRALQTAKTVNVVPENIDPVWVGGTFWQDPQRRKAEVFETGQGVAPAALWPKSGVPAETLEILQRLAAIESLCYQILRK